MVWLREQILHGGGPVWLEPPGEVAPANAPGINRYISISYMISSFVIYGDDIRILNNTHIIKTLIINNFHRSLNIFLVFVHGKGAATK